MRRQQFIKPFYEIGINEGYCANSIIVRLCFCVKLTAEVLLHQNCHYSERKSRLVCRERQMVWRAHCSRESSRLCAIISWSTRTIKLWASMSLHFPIVVQVCHLRSSPLMVRLASLIIFQMIWNTWNSNRWNDIVNGILCTISLLMISWWKEENSYMNLESILSLHNGEQKKAWILFDIVWNENLLNRLDSNISTITRFIGIDFRHLESLLASDSTRANGKETVPSDAFNDRPGEAQRHVIKSNLKLFSTRK